MMSLWDFGEHVQYCIWDNDNYGPGWGWWGSGSPYNEILVNSNMNYYNRYPGGGGYYSLAAGSNGPFNCNFFGMCSLCRC
jgi:hypothetical protein